MGLDNFFKEVYTRQDGFICNYQFSKPYSEWTDEEERFFQEVTIESGLLERYGYEKTTEKDFIVYRPGNTLKAIRDYDGWGAIE